MYYDISVMECCVYLCTSRVVTSSHTDELTGKAWIPVRDNCLKTNW